MKFQSCNWITHGLNFEPGHLEMCCLRTHVGGGFLYLKMGYQGTPLDWDEIFEAKKTYIEENKKGIINPKCEGCFNIYNKEWKENEHYFNYLHFNHWTHCNCRCIYCYMDKDKEYYQTKRYYNVLPVIKDMFDKKLFKTGGEITFAGGEPTILDEFDDLLDLLIENGVDKITIHTSGIKYSKALVKGIKSGAVSVVLSADAGSCETFKKIKNINAYDKFVQNVEKYAEAEDKTKKPLVSTKYILMPNINDNIQEAENWLQMNIKAGVRAIVLDIEHEWFKIQREKSAFPKHARDVLHYILQKADEYGLETILYNSARYFISNENDFPNYDFIPYEYPSLGKIDNEEQKSSV